MGSPSRGVSLKSSALAQTNQHDTGHVIHGGLQVKWMEDSWSFYLWTSRKDSRSRLEYNPPFNPQANTYHCHPVSPISIPCLLLSKSFQLFWLSVCCVQAFRILFKSPILIPFPAALFLPFHLLCEAMLPEAFAGPPVKLGITCNHHWTMMLLHCDTSIQIRS